MRLAGGLAAAMILFGGGRPTGQAQGADDNARRYPLPTIVGADGQARRLDICLHWETSCGCAAALEFCRRQGYAYVQRYATDMHLSQRGVPTAVIADGGRICPGRNLGHNCDGFSEIVCALRPGPLGGGCGPAPGFAQSPPPRPRPRGGRRPAPQFEAARNVPDQSPPRAQAGATPQAGDGGASSVTFSPQAGPPQSQPQPAPQTPPQARPQSPPPDLSLPPVVAPSGLPSDFDTPSKL